MIAHLYKIPSTFRNIPDVIKIQAKPRAEYPGTWRHAELSLPDTLRVIVDDEGDGHLLTVPGNEIISSVYEEMTSLAALTYLMMQEIFFCVVK